MAERLQYIEVVNSREENSHSRICFQPDPELFCSLSTYENRDGLNRLLRTPLKYLLEKDAQVMVGVTGGDGTLGAVFNHFGSVIEKEEGRLTIVYGAGGSTMTLAHALIDNQNLSREIPQNLQKIFPPDKYVARDCFPLQRKTRGPRGQGKQLGVYYAGFGLSVPITHAIETRRQKIEGLNKVNFRAALDSIRGIQPQTVIYKYEDGAEIHEVTAPQSVALEIATTGRIATIKLPLEVSSDKVLMLTIEGYSTPQLAAVMLLILGIITTFKENGPGMVLKLNLAEIQNVAEVTVSPGQSKNGKEQECCLDGELAPFIEEMTLSRSPQGILVIFPKEVADQLQHY